MKEILAQVHRPKTIAMDFMEGNTRIIISRDFIQPPEEQERIKQRLNQIAYEVALKKAIAAAKEREAKENAEKAAEQGEKCTVDEG